jgi:hypothetical protein
MRWLLQQWTGHTISVAVIIIAHSNSYGTLTLHVNTLKAHSLRSAHYLLIPTGRMLTCKVESSTSHPNAVANTCC